MRALLQRNFDIVFYFLATAATLVAFRHLADGYLYNDDFRWMSQARYEMTPRNVLTFQVVGFFRPLMNVIFFVTERVMPGNVRAYYATNLGLHLMNGLVVFTLVRRLARNQAVAAGTSLLFLITSVHYAAVGWISARTALVSTLLLLLSLLLLVGRPRAMWRQCAAALLYVLALAAKEDAAIGVLLLGLIMVYDQGREKALPDRASVVIFALITLAYAVVRTVAMGHFTQPNWGPGPHVFRNLAGGLLYQFYPWSLASLTHVARTIDVPTHALWPEVLAVPVIALLVGAGAWLKRSREVCFALAWLLVAMLPMAPFRIRFFTTEWLTHDRYYYLSSIGACLCIATLLVGIWKMVRWRNAARIAVAAAAVVIVCGEISAVDDSEQRLRHMTTNYRIVLAMTTRWLDREHTLTTCAVEGWPMPPAFLQDVFALERPGWKMVPVRNKAEAGAYRPCLYVRFFQKGVRIETEASTID